MKPDQPPQATQPALPPRYTRQQAARLANPPKRPTASRVAPSLRATDTSIHTGQGRAGAQAMIDAAKPTRYAIPPGYPRRNKPADAT